MTELSWNKLALPRQHIRKRRSCCPLSCCVDSRVKTRWRELTRKLVAAGHESLAMSRPGFAQSARHTHTTVLEASLASRWVRIPQAEGILRVPFPRVTEQLQGQVSTPSTKMSAGEKKWLWLGTIHLFVFPRTCFNQKEVRDFVKYQSLNSATHHQEKVEPERQIIENIGNYFLPSFLSSLFHSVFLSSGVSRVIYDVISYMSPSL